MSTSSFGIFGLGVMGKSLALNVLSKEISLSVYNRDTDEEKNIVNTFINDNRSKPVLGFTEIKDFVNSLQKPRKILIMVKAGKVVDAVIESLLPHLNRGDIIIDGGNSHYIDTNERNKRLKKREINFLGLGVSGGEEGALKGPSLMPGGNKKSYDLVANILEEIAAKDDQGKPCCNYIGDAGAGHFVKMVHNGIEYADMQLLAELYAILSDTIEYSQISKLFSEWNRGELSSYLLDITAKILNEKEGEKYVLDEILDKAGNKGTGSWSSKSALDLGVPTTMKTAAVYARYISSFKEKRIQLSNYTSNKEKKNNVDLIALKEAYDFAQTINLQQGLQLIKAASNEYEWNLNLSEICRIWSNGCIIKSERIKEYSILCKKNDDLFDNASITNQLKKQEESIISIISYALKGRTHIPCLYQAYSYWIAMTTEYSSANLIQAQRDFFGAHTFQKVGDTTRKSFHYNWI